MIRQVGPQNIGEYTCKINSLAGTEEQTATLGIVEKPGMPLNVDAQLMNESMPARVKLTWLEGFDGNSPIINYLAQARQLSAQGKQTGTSAEFYFQLEGEHGSNDPFPPPPLSCRRQD